MEPLEQTRFDNLYQAYLNELILQGKRPKTIDCYSRCLRQVTLFFNTYPDHLSVEQLKHYFLFLATHKSWSAVKKKAGQAYLFLSNCVAHRICM